MTLSCYVHVPFCARICTYCDFYRIVHDTEWEKRYIDAICAEIDLRFTLLANNPPSKTASDGLNLETLYFGGGTPTVLSEESWQRIVARLKRYVAFSGSIEFTTEANPESSTLEKLRLLRTLGANRVSFGAQSFSAANLQRLGRLHNADQIGEAVETARSSGFDNISVDLMYGLPDETDTSFDYDLRSIVALDPHHISFYSLMLEGNVPLRYQVQRREVSLPKDDLVTDRYLRAVCFLADHGFEHYEISNYAKSNWRCRHNLAYWQQLDYIAFGPAAVGTIGGRRYKNEPDIYRYVKSLSHGKLPEADVEELNHGKRLIETIMLSLRMREGLDTHRLQREFDFDILSVRRNLIDALVSGGEVDSTDGHLKLTTKGMFRADMISTALLPDFV